MSCLLIKIIRDDLPFVLFTMYIESFYASSSVPDTGEIQLPSKDIKYSILIHNQEEKIFIPKIQTSLLSLVLHCIWFWRSLTSEGLLSCKGNIMVKVIWHNLHYMLSKSIFSLIIIIYKIHCVVWIKIFLTKQLWIKLWVIAYASCLWCLKCFSGIILICAFVPNKALFYSIIK
jgi:hypothetical protein